jgi:predicted MFS family arabinose efflux permease
MAIYLVALMCVLNHAGFAGSRVLMPLYALTLGADQFAIGVMMSLYALCPMLLAIPAGKLVDRVGARLPMLVGTIGTFVALLLPYFSPGLGTLYLTALVLGTSFQLFFVAVHGTTGAIGGAENRVRNYAAISIGFSMAAFFGPLVAGFAIDHLGHLPTYLVLAGCTVIPALLLSIGPDILPKAAGTAEAQKKSAFDLMRIPRLRNTLIASSLMSAAWDLYLFYFPIYGHAIGLSASAIGAVISSFAAAVVVIRVVLPLLVRRIPEFDVLIYTIAFAGAAFLLFPFFTNPYLLAAVSFVLGFGLGCGQPISGSLIYSLAPPGRAAEGAGIRVMLNNVTHTVVPLFFGALGTALGFVPVFMSCAAILFGGSYYSYRSDRKLAVKAVP